MPQNQSEHAQIEKSSTHRLYFIVAVMGILILILIFYLIKQKIINIDSKIFLYIAIVIIAYLLYLWLTRAKKNMDIYQIIDKITAVEYEKYGRVIDVNELNVAESPKGSGKFSVFSPSLNKCWKFDEKFQPSGVFGRELSPELFFNKREDETSTWIHEMEKQLKEKEKYKEKLQQAGYNVDTGN